MEISRGLDGVVVDTTSISQVTPDTSSLIYRGYPVQDLADQCTFEEVAYLLAYGDLPSRDQLAAFSKRERERRAIDAQTLDMIERFPKDAPGMDLLRTAVSYLGMRAPSAMEFDAKARDEASVDLLAKIPTILAAGLRVRQGKKAIPPRPDLSISENLFHMCFGNVPDKAIVKAFDVSMILYAEHSFNASTFTARVIVSTLSDLYSGVTGAIGALKGPLHGGANEAVMHMLKEIGDVNKAQQWVKDALAQKRKIMGFGHRVYKKGDSRAPTMQRYGLKVAEMKGDKKWHDIAAVVEKTMIESKNIYPNLDFPAGPAYYLMGFDIDLFTPLFVMARITGWCAHIQEQLANNRIIRPLSEYTGAPERKVVPLEKRS
jgi:2-methylcitrate synthase